MNDPTVAFCDVCHFAVIFAIRKAHLKICLIPPLGWSHWRQEDGLLIDPFTDLKNARMQLECVLAQYRTIRRIAING